MEFAKKAIIFGALVGVLWFSFPTSNPLRKLKGSTESDLNISKSFESQSIQVYQIGLNEVSECIAFYNECEKNLLKIKQEKPKEGIEISRIQYENTYKETAKDFIEDGNQQNWSSQNITAATSYVGHRILPSTMKFELLNIPEAGLLTGTLKMLHPTGSEETITFNNEHGYRVFARVNESNSSKVVFEGFIYYRTRSFNPLRRALTVLTEVTFTPIRDGKSTGSIEEISFSSETNSFMDLMVNSLREKHKKLRQFASRKIGPCKKSLDGLADPAALKEESRIALEFFYPAERFIVESLSRQLFTGKAYTLAANGEKEEKTFAGKQVVRVQTSGGRTNSSLLELPSLKLIIPEETYPTLKDNLKPFFSIISATLNEIKEAWVNPSGPGFDLFPPNYLTNKTAAIFVGYNTTREVVFAQKQRQWLEDQGLTVKATMNAEEFLGYLQEQPDIIWIISGKEKLAVTDKIVEKVVELNNKGCPVWLWANNDPFLQEANLILQKITGDQNFSLIGSYRGDQILIPRRDELKRRTFDARNPVSTGFITLFEGIGISYPNKSFPPEFGFQVFAYNSNSASNQPTIFYKLPKANEGVVWVDTGFTKLFAQPKYDEEIKGYVTKVNEYLVEY